MSPPLFQIELDDRKLNFEPSSDLESSDFISYRLSSAARLLLLPRLCSEMSIDSRELITGAAGIADARLGRRPGMPRLAIEVMSSADGSSAGGMQSLEYVFLRLLRAPRLNPHASQGKSCICKLHRHLGSLPGHFGSSTHHSLAAEQGFEKSFSTLQVNRSFETHPLRLTATAPWLMSSGTQPPS